MNGPRTGGVPPAWLIAPYFVAGPLGLAVAGLALLTAPPGTLDAPTTPVLIAATHATVLGWVTLTIMGATLQLVPAVLGGPLPLVRPAVAALLMAIGSLPLFVVAFAGWQLPLLELAAGGLVAAITLYLVAVASPLLHGTVTGPALTSLRYAHVLLGATVVVGLTWAFALSRGWFPVTPERVAAHALLGLVGWVAISISGVTYRLLPMFEIANDAEPRYSRFVPHALATAGPVLFALYLFGAPPPLRLAAATATALILAAWLCDAVRIHRRRLRRRPSLHSRATAWSFAWLAAGLPLGIAAATPGAPAGRLLIAFGFVMIPGWAGATLVANSSRIIPFIAWYHRFAHAAGTTWTPGTADLFPTPLAGAGAAAILATPLLGASAALVQELILLRLAGVAALFGGLLFAAALTWPFFVPARPPRTAGASPAAGLPR